MFLLWSALLSVIIAANTADALTSDKVCICDFYLSDQNRSTQWTLPFVHTATNCTTENCDEVYAIALNASARETFLVPPAEASGFTFTEINDCIRIPNHF